MTQSAAFGRDLAAGLDDYDVATDIVSCVEDAVEVHLAKETMLIVVDLGPGRPAFSMAEVRALRARTAARLLAAGGEVPDQGRARVLEGFLRKPVAALDVVTTFRLHDVHPVPGTWAEFKNDVIRQKREVHDRALRDTSGNVSAASRRLKISRAHFQQIRKTLTQADE